MNAIDKKYNFLRTGIDIWRLMVRVKSSHMFSFYSTVNYLIRELGVSASADLNQLQQDDYVKALDLIEKLLVKLRQISGKNEDGTDYEYNVPDVGAELDPTVKSGSKVSVNKIPIQLPDANHLTIDLIGDAPYVIHSMQNTELMTIMNYLQGIRAESIICQSARTYYGIIIHDLKRQRKALNGVREALHVLFSQPPPDLPKSTPSKVLAPKGSLYVDEGYRDYGSTPKDKIPDSRLDAFPDDTGESVESEASD